MENIFAGITKKAEGRWKSEKLLDRSIVVVWDIRTVKTRHCYRYAEQYTHAKRTLRRSNSIKNLFVLSPLDAFLMHSASFRASHEQKESKRGEAT